MRTNTVTTIAVSNDGTIAFSDDTQLYRWDRATGLLNLDEVEWSRGANVSISNDSSIVSFSSIKDGGQYGTVVYQDSQKSFIPNTKVLVAGREKVGGVSKDGSMFGGSSAAYGKVGPVIYNSLTGDIFNFENQSGPSYWFVRDINEQQKALISGHYRSFSEGFFPLYYLWSPGTSPELIDGISVAHRLSSDGFKVLGTSKSCESEDLRLCAVLWDTNQKTFTELGNFRPSSISRNGGLVTGIGLGAIKGGIIWSASDGLESFVSHLAQSGYSGWDQVDGLVVSDNGKYFAGFASSEGRPRRPFVFESDFEQYRDQGQGLSEEDQGSGNSEQNVEESNIEKRWGYRVRVD